MSLICFMINYDLLDEQTAPLPYKTKAGGTGNWDDPDTWENGDVQYLPGGVSYLYASEADADKEAEVTNHQCNLLGISSNNWTITVQFKNESGVTEGKVIQGTDYSKFTAIMKILNDTRKVIIAYDGYTVINLSQI